MDVILPFLGPLLLVAAVPLVVLAVLPSGGRPSRLAAYRPAKTTPPPFAPRALIERMERNLQLAGLATQWSLRTLVIAKLVLLAVALVVATLLVLWMPTATIILVAVIVVIVSYFVPDLIVWGRARERQDTIQLELADTLDQILISVEAGLGLETAIERAGRHGRGPLAAELARTVQDMRVGASRREAYSALAARTEVVDLQRFARAIMQADEYGVSIGNVVRTQAKDLRAKRRQRAEEKAMRVPVQVLFPLMFCILPVLFIVVLAPAVANLLSSFAAL
ncbi:tight adherence protein C [Microbacteriaceae bacterium SG_E_30_P1]|uniref:Tight adherence protein C n=1 Tax=Antiquaquibacter oligotrophicus TaxID=2880260 RepID=A0ABT6KQP0_9MICO|nr:type II secretion system F family protein [Antiquaquibacter oligotrophicus]MDH6182301.1 tight adherence protein C [Antiquaquibacter oligotrophicus]UDF12044.1 type II secretion system F family protein [Antiquaquibacter oligotrophicus]